MKSLALCYSIDISLFLVDNHTVFETQRQSLNTLKRKHQTNYIWINNGGLGNTWPNFLGRMVYIEERWSLVKWFCGAGRNLWRTAPHFLWQFAAATEIGPSPLLGRAHASNKSNCSALSRAIALLFHSVSSSCASSYHSHHRLIIGSRSR